MNLDTLISSTRSQLRKLRLNSGDGTCNAFPGWEPRLNPIGGETDADCRLYPMQGESGMLLIPLLLLLLLLLLFLLLLLHFLPSLSLPNLKPKSSALSLTRLLASSPTGLGDFEPPKLSDDALTAKRASDPSVPSLAGLGAGAAYGGSARVSDHLPK